MSTSDLPLFTWRHDGLETPSFANLSGSWQKRYRRTKDIRTAVFWGILSELRRRNIHPTPNEVYHVTLTRIAPKYLDSDNLARALKAVRDGVADAFAGEYGKGDDRDVSIGGRFLWGVKQDCQSPVDVAVVVEIREAVWEG